MLNLCGVVVKRHGWGWQVANKKRSGGKIICSRGVRVMEKQMNLGGVWGGGGGNRGSASHNLFTEGARQRLQWSELNQTYACSPPSSVMFRGRGGCCHAMACPCIQEGERQVELGSKAKGHNNNIGRHDDKNYTQTHWA